MQENPINKVVFLSTEFLSKRYQTLHSLSIDLETDLLRFLSQNAARLSDGKLDPVNTDGKSLTERFENFYIFIVTTENLAHSFFQFIPDTQMVVFQLQIIQAYCLYLYAHRILHHLQETEYVVKNWAHLNIDIVYNYPKFPKEFHASSKRELYLCQTLISILQAYNGDHAKWDSEKREKFIQTLQIFNSFIKNITNPSLLPHCYLALFKLENNPLIRPLVEKVNEESIAKEDFYLLKIIPVIQSKLETTDGKLFEFCAYATYFFNQAYYLNYTMMITLEPEAKLEFRNKKVFPQSTMRIDIRDTKAVLDHLKIILEHSKLLEGIDFIISLKQTGKPLGFGKIFQTPELINELACLYNQTLEHFDKALSITIDIAIENEAEKPFIYEMYKFRKEILSLSMQINELDKDLFPPEEPILDRLDKTICAIKSHENEIELYKRATTAKEIEDSTVTSGEENIEEIISSEKPSDPPQKTYPEPIILHKQIPLPEVYNSLYRTLKANGYKVFLVGGVIRDFLQGEKPFDIDVVVFHPTLNLSKPDLMKHLLSLAKDVVGENCELRSQRNPIVYVEKDKTIIEISVFKRLDFTAIQNIFCDQELLPILYDEAKWRDSTENAMLYDGERIIDFFDGIKHLLEEEQLHCIRLPDITFREDNYRVFRVLRSIIRRSANNSSLSYSPQIITAMKNYSKSFQDLNKDKCFSEIKKILFRGNAHATWKFLIKQGFENDFFLMASESEVRNTHLPMVNKLLTDLDYRIKLDKNYNEALVFAVLFWGSLQEKIENYEEENLSKNIYRLCLETLDDPRIIFRLPQEIYTDITMIWQTHLSKNNSLNIDNTNYDKKYSRLANVFSSLIDHAINLVSQKKVNQLIAASNTSFFVDQQIELRMKALIKEYNLEYTKENNTFTLSFSDSTCFMSLDAKRKFLKNLLLKFQTVLGPDGIQFTQEKDSISIKSTSVLRSRTIASLMEFLYVEEDSRLTNAITV